VEPVATGGQASVDIFTELNNKGRVRKKYRAVKTYKKPIPKLQGNPLFPEYDQANYQVWQV
jgi:hypothetical protein